MRTVLLKYKYLIILLLIAFFTHLSWFNLFNILTYSDWYYWPDEAVIQLFSSYGTWINFWNFGSVNIQLQFNLFKFLWAFFANSGLSYDQAAKITFLIPIAISGFLSPYFLSKKLFGDSLISFTVAIFYGTTTHFLIRQTAHLTIAFIYSIAPVILLLFIYALEKNRLSSWILFSLVYSIGLGYETRIMYIVTFILFFYFLLFHSTKWNNLYKNIIITCLIIALLNSFWILPIFLGGGFNEAQGVFNRGLFGNDLFSLTKAFTIFESSWTGYFPNTSFVPQPVIWYFWAFPIIAFSALLINSKNEHHKRGIIFFSILSLTGIFLTKQSAEPFPAVYLWLYDNFPGFNLFREASKFYLITAIGYFGLLGFALILIKENKKISKVIFYGLILIIILFSMVNLKPLITGEIGTMFVPREVPKDYLVFKDDIIKQPEYFRTLWVPVSSRWGIYANNHPKANTVELIQSEWKGYMNYELKGYNWPVNEQITYIFKNNIADNLLDVSSIKYVVIPIQDIANDDDFFSFYGNRDYFIQEMRTINYLNEINIGTKELLLFENKGYLGHFYISSVNQSIEKLDKSKISSMKYEFVNPAEYKIYFESGDPFYLYFSEAYNPNWILVQNINWYKDENKLFDETHFKAFSFLNGWYIKPDELTKNKDGLYELTLYFKPQSYFYLGLFLAGTTLIGCFSYLIRDWRKRRKGRLQEVVQIAGKIIK